MFSNWNTKIQKVALTLALVMLLSFLSGCTPLMIENPILTENSSGTMPDLAGEYNVFLGGSIEQIVITRKNNTNNAYVLSSMDGGEAENQMFVIVAEIEGTDAILAQIETGEGDLPKAILLPMFINKDGFTVSHSISAYYLVAIILSRYNLKFDSNDIVQQGDMTTEQFRKALMDAFPEMIEANVFKDYQVIFQKL